MEIILSVLLILGIIWYLKLQEYKSYKYSKTYQIDYGKVNNDRIKNNLSNTQISKNIINGKYNK